MAGETCVKCGAVHGFTPSVVNKWHKCTKCGATYCPDCGRQLPGKTGLLASERTCDHPFVGRKPCEGRTILF
jgi:hypothetical protein